MKRGRGGGALLAWSTTAASPQITMEIYISDWTHMFQMKTGLDATANSEFYKSNRVNSAAWSNMVPIMSLFCPMLSPHGLRVPYMVCIWSWFARSRPGPFPVAGRHKCLD